jgi:hypothetical protein
VEQIRKPGEFKALYSAACERIEGLDKFEKLIRKKLGKRAHVSGTDWYLRTPAEKIALATLLVARYLLDGSDLRANSYTFDQFLDVPEVNTINVYPAKKVPFLIIMQLAHLQNLFSCGIHEGFDAVMESYAGKGRGGENVDLSNLVQLNKTEVAEVVGANLMLKNTNSSPGAMWKFYDFMKENDFFTPESMKKDNIFILGIGCTFDAGAGHYPIVAPVKGNPNDNPFFAVESAEHPSDLLEDVIDRSTNDEDIENFEDDEPFENTEVSAVEWEELALKEIAMKETCETSEPEHDDEDDENTELDWATGAEFFYVGGRTFPKCMLPSTHQEQNIRYQQYSVPFRNAEDLKLPYSRIVGLPYTNVNEEDKSFNFGNLLLQHKRFNDNIRVNMRKLAKKGNIARIEIAEDNSKEENSSFESLLRNGIIHSLHRIEKNLKCFDAAPVANVAEFFANALLARIWTFQEFVDSYFVEETKGDYYPLIKGITEIASFSKNFYRGRGTKFDGYIVGKKASMKYQRPVLSVLPGYLCNFIRERTQDRVNLYWEVFCSILQFHDQKVYDPDKVAYCEYESKVMACSRCFRLFTNLYDKDKYCLILEEFDEHPCYKTEGTPTHHITDVNDIEERTEAEVACSDGKCDSKLISVNNKRFLKHLKSELELLTTEQLNFINVVTADSNSDSDQTRKSVHHLLTGIAGSGKSRTVSVLIKKCAVLDEGINRTAVCALTKTASGLVYGSTLHSTFGLKLADINSKNLISNTFAQIMKGERKGQFFRLRNIKRFIIDECSLIQAQGLDNINKMLQYIMIGTISHGGPFGGVRMILVGDPLQLISIVTDKNIQDKKRDCNVVRKLNEVEGFHFFQYAVFWDYFHIYILTKSHRHSEDPEMLKLLNFVRIGDVTSDPELLAKINTWGRNVPESSISETIKALYTLVPQEFEMFKGIPDPETQKKLAIWRKSENERFLKRLGQSIQKYCEENSKRYGLQSGRFKGDLSTLAKTTIICAQHTECKAVSDAFDRLLYDKSNENHGTIKAKFPNGLGNASMALIEKNEAKIFKNKLEIEFRYYPGKIVRFTSNQTAGHNNSISNNLLGVVKRVGKRDEEGNVISLFIEPLYSDPRIESIEVEVFPAATEFEFKCSDIPLTCNQIRVVSGYTGTDYLAQGITFPCDRFLVYNNQRTTSPGSLYTVLSRTRTTNNIYVLHPLVLKDITSVDKTARAFWTECWDMVTMTVPNEWMSEKKTGSPFPTFPASRIKAVMQQYTQEHTVSTDEK